MVDTDQRFPLETDVRVGGWLAHRKPAKIVDIFGQSASRAAISWAPVETEPLLDNELKEDLSSWTMIKTFGEAIL